MAVGLSGSVGSAVLALAGRFKVSAMKVCIFDLEGTLVKPQFAGDLDDAGAFEKAHAAAVLRTLQTLSARGDHGLALATRGPKQAAEAWLENEGIGRLLSVGAFAEDGENKTQILAATVVRCNAAWPGENQFVFIGDAAADAAAAESLEIGFIAVGPLSDRGELQVSSSEFLAVLDGQWVG